MTGGTRRSGLPSRSSRRHMRSSLRSMTFGCSSRRRVRIASLIAIVASPAASLGSRLALRRLVPLHLLLGRQLVPVGRRLHEKPDDPRHGLAHLMAVDDHVDHSVLQQIFGTLESIRKLLAYGLLDDAR